MSEKSKIFGKGSANTVLEISEMREIVEDSLKSIQPNSKVLAIIPDTSRDDNTHLLFPIIAKILPNLDALVAQGTHPPISEAEKLHKIGLTEFDGKIFDHEWNNPHALTKIGTIYGDEINQITNGAFSQDVDITVNRLILDYDVLLILGATVPHEVAGFAGSSKYFFPGISGADLTNATHWIGALAGIENIIGRIETPTRHLIEKATDFITKPIINLNSVVSRNSANHLQTHALFVGNFRESFRKACEISRQIHIKFVGKSYKIVVAILDEHYTELWTGGKASYKLGGIIEDGGELVIYAPHLTEISITHGNFIEKYGYAPIEKVKIMVAESEELNKNLCVAAHLAHVSFAGSQKNPLHSKYQITLATQVNAEVCKKINLVFADFNSINLDEFRKDPETFVVENAGRDLYLLEETD
ncbi:MAG TPA: lactate racemase domain-containing protein [Pyrinomonadaceae bacterium]|nr:lactate racemase domain-containing protein [Pyrinomonadaceae bacterium]